MTDSLNILILEDEPIIAMDLTEFCNDLGHNVVAVCYTYVDALEQIEKENPNFALVDIRIGNADDGILFGKKLNEEYGIPFIYITSFFDEKTIALAKKTYPSGYVVKPIQEGNLVAAIAVGLSNHHKWRNSENLMEANINEYAHTALTKRELVTVQDLLAGKTNFEMAEAQFVSVNTVKTHLKNIYQKLNVTSRGQLIVLLNK